MCEEMSMHVSAGSLGIQKKAVNPLEMEITFSYMPSGMGAGN